MMVPWHDISRQKEKLLFLLFSEIPKTSLLPFSQTKKLVLPTYIISKELQSEEDIFCCPLERGHLLKTVGQCRKKEWLYNSVNSVRDCKQTFKGCFERNEEKDFISRIVRSVFLTHCCFIRKCSSSSKIALFPFHDLRRLWVPNLIWAYQAPIS